MLKKITIILILTVLFPFSAQASDSWSKQDLYRELVYVAIAAIDIGQTKQAMQNGYREMNPFLKGKPSDIKINKSAGAGLLLHVLISNYLSSENREKFQNITIIFHANIIARNHIIGARLNF